jgi:hypothetical protein
VGESSASVEDVFDDDDVAVFDIAVDVLFNLDDAGATGGSMPTTDLHELELAITAEFPECSREVAEEVDGAFQDSEQDDGLVGGRDAGRNLLGELTSFRLNIFVGDQNFEAHGAFMKIPWLRQLSAEKLLAVRGRRMQRSGI